jgi:peptide/nickel transport system substrate-binding protein
VDEHVTFSPYRTTFELAEVTVDDGHWPVTGGGAGPGTRTARSSAKPGFAGAAGNAC